MSGAYPWTTAAGWSAATVTGRNPRSRTAMRRPMPPITSTGAPAGRCSASSRAAACAEVMSSPGRAGTPSPVSCAAMAAGVREALLVTKASRMPDAAALASASAAPEMGDPPRYTTPSRSSRATSYREARGSLEPRSGMSSPAGAPPPRGGSPPIAGPVTWARRRPGPAVRRVRPASGPPAWPGPRAAHPRSAPVPGAWPRPAQGAPQRRPDPRTWRGRGRGRSERSRHSGSPPRSGENCPPPAHTGLRRTAPGPGPHGRCGRRARPPRPAPAVRRPRQGSPGSAGRDPDGTKRSCRLLEPAGRRRTAGPPGPHPGLAGRHRPGDLHQNGNRSRRAVLLTYVQILPSGAPPAAGLVLAPFRGLRYAQDRVSGLAEVTSPPYDVIAHDAEDHLLASDPHNIVRLILPRHVAGNPRTAGNGAAGPGRAVPATGAAYADAAWLLRDWQDSGILVADPLPALYLYEQSLPAGPVLQRGLIGALRLAPLGAGPVLPHEDVIPGPVAGRRQLMEATGANLEPIFLLYDGPDEPGGPSPGATTRLTTEVATQLEPLLSVDTDDSIRHRLWAVTDPAEQAAIAADLASRQALIADGHHRYAAYLQLQARKRTAGAGPGPWDAGLALLVDSTAFPPRIGAIHRVVAGLAPAEGARLAEDAFTVQPLPGAAAPEALETLRRAGTGHMAFLLAGGGEFYLLTDPDPRAAEEAMPGRSARWRGLSAAVMQELLLGRLWGIRDDEERVEIHHDALAALRAASRPPGATAVICPPLSTEDVREVAAHGERVPRKSTSFAPKPRTGLVLRSFALG